MKFYEQFAVLKELEGDVFTHPFVKKCTDKSFDCHSFATRFFYEQGIIPDRFIFEPNIPTYESFGNKKGYDIELRRVIGEQTNSREFEKYSLLLEYITNNMAYSDISVQFDRNEVMTFEEAKNYAKKQISCFKELCGDDIISRYGIISYDNKERIDLAHSTIFRNDLNEDLEVLHRPLFGLKPRLEMLSDYMAKCITGKYFYKKENFTLHAIGIPFEDLL